MAKYVGKDEREKAFMQKFDILTGGGKRNPWEVWKDMVRMFAIAISNAVDMRYKDEREREYLTIIGKYDKDEQQVFPELFAMLVDVIDGSGNYRDFLGELFMKLEINSKGAGQYFTPYNIAKLMAHMSIDADKAKEKIEERGYITVLEPSCGAGATLIGAAEALYEAGINYQRHAIFVGQDKDGDVALMCYIQLSLLGCAGYVVIGDTLAEPTTAHSLFGENASRCWCTPMFFSHRFNYLRRMLKERGESKTEGKKAEQLSMF